MRIAGLLILVLILSLVKPLNSQPDSFTPGRLVLIGGVIAGVEIIHGLISLLSGKEDSQDEHFTDTGDTNAAYMKAMNELEKYELLAKLSAKSRLFDVIEGKSEASMQTNREIKLLMQKIIERQPKEERKGLLTEEEIQMVQSFTQNVAKAYATGSGGETSETNYQISQYKITPFETRFEYIYKATNKQTGEIVTRKGFHYYEAGKNYFLKGKKKKAKEYFLRAIAQKTDRKSDRISKARSIVFLERYYNMNLDMIIKEVKRIKEKEK